MFQILLPTMNLLTRGQVVKRLKEAKVIRPYLPLFGPSRASAVLHTLTHKKSERKNSWLYKIGYGEKSVTWY